MNGIFLKTAISMSTALILGAIFAAQAFAAQSAPAPEAAGSGKQNWDGVYDKDKLVAPAHWSTTAIKYLSKLGYCDYFDESMIEEGKNFRLPKKTGTAKLAVQAYGAMREKLNEDEPVPFEAWLMLGALGGEYQKEIKELGQNPADMFVLAGYMLPQPDVNMPPFADMPEEHWIVNSIDLLFREITIPIKPRGFWISLTNLEVYGYVSMAYKNYLRFMEKGNPPDSGLLWIISELEGQFHPMVKKFYNEYASENDYEDIRVQLRSRPEFPKLI